MKSLRGRDCWPFLRINDALLEELLIKHTAGASTDELITWLHAKDVTKPGATLALRLTSVVASHEAKLAVHVHPAYAYRRDADEAFEEAVVVAMEELSRSEAA